MFLTVTIGIDVVTHVQPNPPTPYERNVSCVMQWGRDVMHAVRPYEQYMMMMMMMMIVDLYSALRKAPLLRYVSRGVVKRNVFSADRYTIRYDTVD